MASPAHKLPPNPRADTHRDVFARDVIAGLTAPRKHLPPKYFYDDAGCALFERITQLPEYYPTRTELSILSAHAHDIGQLVPEGVSLIEFGAGKSTKARILLRAIDKIDTYVPVDIAEDFLLAEAERVRKDFPRLTVTPVVADFTSQFTLPESVQKKPQLGFFPGSTIGNFEPHEASAFLQRISGVLSRDAVLIVGVDTVKDTQVLTSAYNDKQGVTAAFNLNLLTRMNRELGANFRRDCFEHHAVFNPARSRIEMHLASLKRQKVRVAGETIGFRPGETIHTESSYKYSIETFGALARGSGWKPAAVWTDEGKNFSVHALRQDAAHGH